MRYSTRLFLISLLAAVFAGGLVPSLAAQRIGKEWYTDSVNGYRFRYPEGWMVVPIEERESLSGAIAQFEGPDMATRINNQSYDTNPTLKVFLFKPAAAITRDDDEGTGGLRHRIDSSGARKDISELIPQHYRISEFEAEEPIYDKDVKIKKLVTDRRSWKAFVSNAYYGIFDTYTFQLEDYNIVLVGVVPEQHFKKYGKLFLNVAKTFELVEKVDKVVLGDKNDYASLLEYHKQEVSRTPGWQLLESPSKRYLIKTSVDDDEFLEAIIKRLENSRDLFEREFPPAKPIEHVSVVRVCSTLEEFHRYGKTGGGVAGWFSPSTTELVLVDFKNYDRNITYGVMTHEGFHQYCHFLFDESEAHRWFDEGHGDYYGAFEFKGKKAIAKAKMKGFSRLTGIREQIRENSFTPIGKHIRQSHGEWQRKGVASYAQSWSIIYYLRQGMDGRVPKKLWRAEYADVIPNYMNSLHEGYLKAYEEIDEDIQEALDKIEDELPLINRRMLLGSDKKKEIWETAIEDSWGPIDMDEFTELWKTYVAKNIRN